MSVFLPSFEALSDEAFRHHFLDAKAIACPEPHPAPHDVLARAREIVAGVFTETGETHRLSASRPWMENPSRDKEWQIALHKHGFAVDLMQALVETGDPVFLDAWVGLVESWLVVTYPGCLTASDAHVDAKRIESSVAAFQLLRLSPLRDRVEGAFLRRYLARIAEDACYVAENLRPARNHRTFQLYALVLVGVLFPEFSKARELLDMGREKLIENLLHDFGVDGVHIECSTHYHNITLETALAFVKLSRMNGLDVPGALRETLVKALEFSAFVQFPDGEIPLLNDSDNGDHSAMLRDGAVLFERPDFLWAATRGTQGLPPAAASRCFNGYAVLSDGWGHDAESFARRQHIVFDMAPLGEGSHSHYDLLNITWFAGGRQILIDPGRFTYNADAGDDGLDWRHAFKSTRFHNTVEIDGRNQTRYFSKAKRVAAGLEALDRARHKVKHGPEIELRGTACAFGQHIDWAIATGVSHEYAPVHTRALLFVEKSYVAIIDHVEMTDDALHRIALRYHFADGELGRISLSTHAGRHVLCGEGFALHVLAPVSASAAIEQGWISKTYGIKRPAPVLEIHAEGTTSLSFVTLLVPDGSLCLDEMELSSDELGVVKARVRGRDGRDVIEDRFEVRSGIGGLRFGRFSASGTSLRAAGNLSEAGVLVEAYEARAPVTSRS